ncbi:unnamed protein product [Eruca vesicaria subsp. sativa]|uniref:Uncharacterized protein n=1 Tax=Eruca vesicaria subsp. sativa TaxID=29727 RepID=A0ABC8L4N3_ERUVS|nr:unnamed protein product [Eruca vesicaria subsp. sativa]
MSARGKGGKGLGKGRAKSEETQESSERQHSRNYQACDQASCSQRRCEANQRFDLRRNERSSEGLSRECYKRRCDVY